jgi:hypothetical protein
VAPVPPPVAPSGSPAVTDADTGLERSETIVTAKTVAAAAIPTGASAATAPSVPSGGAAAATPSPRVETTARPVGRPQASGRGIGRTPLLVALAVLGLAIVVGGVGAFLLLPSVSAVVVPREESIGPVALNIEASTSVTEPDVEAGIVPALAIDVPVEASASFPATGTRVEETKATGTVRFDNLDPTTSNSIRKGAEVSTSNGVRFRTDEAVTVPAAELVGLQIFPASATVDVTAVDAGPDGNVAANAILSVPRGEEPLFLKVTNPDPTSGGSRTEFARVTQDDVDAAVAALTDSLDSAFADRLDDDDLAPPDHTVFPETAELGLAVTTVDPDSLVGQEVESFELGASAMGTVLAVDSAPVREIAEARLAASVEAGHEMVDGSSEITEAPAVVEGGTITYPVVVTARQVPLLDPAVLEAEILGRPVEEARSILELYGTVDMEVWPDWVATVPTFDARVEVIVDGPVAIEAPGMSPGATESTP